jgi:hypothetical protein
MIARKLDSDFTITKRLINRVVKKAISDELPAGRSNKFVQNYVFGVGGGGSNFGGNGQSQGKTTGLVYDPADPGVISEQTRAKIQGLKGVYLHDNPSEDSINIVAEAVNDPFFWLGI